jgi:phosphopantetheine--protein transferase-like protein
MDWRQVEVVPDVWGRPTLVLHGELASAVQATLGPVVIHLSITHEPTMAAAVVVIEGA